MASTDCGGAPITGVVAIPLGNGVSLTLVRSDSGFCFSKWIRFDGQLMPQVSEEDSSRVFATPDEAKTFFSQALSERYAN